MALSGERPRHGGAGSFFSWGIFFQAGLPDQFGKESLASHLSPVSSRFSGIHKGGNNARKLSKAGAHRLVGQTVPVTWRNFCGTSHMQKGVQGSVHGVFK